MIRIKRGAVAKKRRKKILKMNKGFRDSSKSLFRVANQKYLSAKVSSYKNRRKIKRSARNLWTHRINSAVKIYGLSFNQFVHLCLRLKIKLNRKVVSQLALYDPECFFNEFKPYLLD